MQLVTYCKRPMPSGYQVVFPVSKRNRHCAFNPYPLPAVLSEPLPVAGERDRPKPRRRLRPNLRHREVLQTYPLKRKRHQQDAPSKPVASKNMSTRSITSQGKMAQPRMQEVGIKKIISKTPEATQSELTIFLRTMAPGTCRTSFATLTTIMARGKQAIRLTVGMRLSQSTLYPKCARTSHVTSSTYSTLFLASQTATHEAPSPGTLPCPGFAQVASMAASLLAAEEPKINSVSPPALNDQPSVYSVSPPALNDQPSAGPQEHAIFTPPRTFLLPRHPHQFGFTGGSHPIRNHERTGDTQAASLPVPDLSSDSDFPPEVSKAGRARRPKMPPFRTQSQRSQGSGSEPEPLTSLASQPLAPRPEGPMEEPTLASIHECQTPALTQTSESQAETVPEVPQAAQSVGARAHSTSHSGTEGASSASPRPKTQVPTSTASTATPWPDDQVEQRLVPRTSKTPPDPGGHPQGKPDCP